MANLTFRALLLCSLVLGVGCSKKSPQAVEKVAIEKKPTLQARVIEDDFKILDVVLLDLLGFDDFTLSRPIKIVLDPMTGGSGDLRLRQTQIDVEANGDEELVVSLELGDDLRRRNPEKPMSLAGYKSPSSKILVEPLVGPSSNVENSEELANDRRFRLFGSPPHVDRFVIAWLPGYSKDGNTAVFRAFFGPSGHGANVTYKLAKKDGKWTVVWRFVARYA